MQNKAWNHIYNCRDPDITYNLLINEITDSMQSTIPEKVVANDTKNKNAWITKDIKKSISHKK